MREHKQPTLEGLEKWCIEQIKSAVTSAEDAAHGVIKRLNSEYSPIGKTNQLTNIEYELGRYHAMLDMLWEINPDTCCCIHDSINDRIEALLKQLNEIYEYLKEGE